MSHLQEDRTIRLVGCVLGYAQNVVLRANIPYGTTPKEKVAAFCVEDTGIRERLLYTYDRESRKTNIELLEFTPFISVMRGQFMRRIAQEATIMHGRRIEDKAVSGNNQTRPYWADNPNAYLQINSFLINAALLNEMRASEGELISDEQAAMAANAALKGDRLRAYPKAPQKIDKRHP